MAPAVNIKSFERVIPMIYAYTHPNYPPHQGWTKIGYTDKQSVEDRVRQQNHTAGIDYGKLSRQTYTSINTKRTIRTETSTYTKAGTKP